jgi:hypothetical protein
VAGAGGTAAARGHRGAALAPVSNVSTGDVRRVIGRVKERLSRPKAPRRAADVLAATYVLLGLRYSEQVAQALFEEVLGMEESSTYQAIVRKGRVVGRAEEARRLLLLQGEEKFGQPDAAARSAIENISDLEQLEALGVRLITASSWEDLLAAQGPRHRSGPRRQK